MRELKTSIDINAPAATVWAVLTYFPSYPDWNPLITSAEGKPLVGTKLKTRMKLPGGTTFRISPRLRVVEPERELRWFGTLLIPGIFDGEHIFVIEPVSENKVHFRQEEKFYGVLVPLFGFFLKRTRQGFEAMNEALKRRCEAGVSDTRDWRESSK